MWYSLGVRWAGDWLVSTGEDPDSGTSGAKCCPTLGTLVVMSSPLTKGLYPLMADHSQSWIPKMQNSLLVWAKTICGVVSQKMENFSPRNDFFLKTIFSVVICHQSGLKKHTEILVFFLIHWFFLSRVLVPLTEEFLWLWSFGFVLGLFSKDSAKLWSY